VSVMGTTHLCSTAVPIAPGPNTITDITEESLTNAIIRRDQEHQESTLYRFPRREVARRIPPMLKARQANGTIKKIFGGRGLTRLQLRTRAIVPNVPDDANLVVLVVA